MVPGLHDRPGGCLFAPRCAYADGQCHAAPPRLRELPGGRVRCHYPLGLAAPARTEAVS
jgi:dipeptide transport system ATP-binding protein